jgi:hypothetical protein
VSQQDEMLAVLRAAYDVAVNPTPVIYANREVLQHYVARRRLVRLLVALSHMSTLTDEARARIEVRLDAALRAEVARS